MGRNKLLLAGVGLATALGMAAALPSGFGQTQQSGAPKPEPIVIPIAQPTPPALPSGQPPMNLPLTSGWESLPVSGRQPVGIPNGNSSSLANIFPQTGVAPVKSSPVDEFLKRNFDAPDPNKDIAVVPGAGKYLICITSYQGPDAPKWAREMAVELHNTYKFPSVYVYTKGAEECKAEQKRIRDEMQRQQKWNQDHGTDLKPRIPHINYDLDCAVLVGGYKDLDSARSAYLKVKDLPLPDPNKVKLQTECSFKMDPKTGRTEGRQDSPINPFKHCMIVPNPTNSARAETGPTPTEMETVKRMNKAEPFSLLKCPKPFTLLVRAYPLSAEIQTNKGMSGIFGPKSPAKSNTKDDPAALSAHNLAELINKAGGHWHAYVWHDIHYSFVTVGEYDSENDPRLKNDQQLLPTVNSQLDVSSKLMETPLPMEVDKITYKRLK